MKSINESLDGTNRSTLKSVENDSRMKKSLQSDLNPKFMEKISPSGIEKKSRYGRVQKEVITQAKSPTSNIHTLTGFFRLSPNSRSQSQKPKIFTEALAETLVKKNRHILQAHELISRMNTTDSHIENSLLHENDSEENFSKELSKSVNTIFENCDITNNNNRHDLISKIGIEVEEQKVDNDSGKHKYAILDDFEVVPEIKNSPPKVDDYNEVDNLDDSLESPDFEIHDPSILKETETENDLQEEQLETSEFEQKMDTTEITDNSIVESSSTHKQNHEEKRIIPQPLLDLSTSKSEEEGKLYFVKSPDSKDSANGSSIDAEIVSVQAGELFWAQIGNYPYWPCMISPDPEKKTVSYKENIATKSHIIYHVRFFADNGRRSWVKEDKLLPYNGRESFVQKFENKPRSTDKAFKQRRSSIDKLYRKTLKNKTWELAISEADSLKKYSNQMRLKKFDEILELSRNENKQMRRLSKSSLHDSQDSLLSSSTVPVNKRARSISTDSTIVTNSPIPPIKKMKLNNPEKEKEADFKVFSETLKNFFCNGKNDPKTNEKWSAAGDINKLWELFVHSHDGMTDITLKRFAVKISSTREKCLNLDTSVTEIKKKREFRSIDEVVDDIFNLGTDYLFEDLTNDIFCKFCKKTSVEDEVILKCTKLCGSHFHNSCLKNEMKRSKKNVHKDNKILIGPKHDIDLVACDECQLNENHITNCFVCREQERVLENGVDEKSKCLSLNCGKYYHKSCLKMWPQSTWHTASSKVNFVCPSHTCHTCVSDNPRGKSLQNCKTKFLKCVLCPASYHKSSTCIPAGTQLINNSYVVCPRHDQNNSKKHVNVDWCFFCAEGGELICCETCPASVHLSCLNSSIPSGKYNCDDCESGRLPLYGELVWVRFGLHRWWPSIILPPTETPLNIRKMKHFPSEFVVRFFGTNDHAWISRSRVYLCQDDDWDVTGPNNSTQFLNGVQEAKRVMEIIKSKKSDSEASGLQKTDEIHTPFPYVKLKVNRLVHPVKYSDLYDGDKISCCNCQKDLQHPCGPDTGCLNRSLFIECDPKTCPAGERCENQLFEKRIYPNMRNKYLNGKGFGLIALENIPSGTFVTEYVGEIIDSNEYHRRLKQQEHDKNDDYYFLTLQNNYYIDAGPKGNIGRFMNHSCEPNCETQKWTVRGITRIGLFAIKDIKKNEELTFNYMFQSASLNKKVCFCQSSKCSGFIGEKYIEKTGIGNVKTQSKKGVSGKPKK